jgi:F-type H+-transporting ATPase subunit alpha
VGAEGYLDDIPTADVPRFQEDLREHLRAEKTIYQEIRDSQELSDELTQRLKAELERFKSMFNVAEPAPAAALLAGGQQG